MTGAGTRTAAEVLIQNRQPDACIDASRYRTLVQRVLRAEGVPPESQAAVAFVGPEEMARLNERHMGVAGPTDVLAFPVDLPTHLSTSLPADLPNCLPSDPGPGTEPTSTTPVGAVLTGTVLVGDVVVCPAVAASNASANTGSRPGHDGSVTAEIDLLVVHGLLHLLGMDHAEPEAAAAMRARETDHLQPLWADA